MSDAKVDAYDEIFRTVNVMDENVQVKKKKKHLAKKGEHRKIVRC